MSAPNFKGKSCRISSFACLCAGEATSPAQCLRWTLWIFRALQSAMCVGTRVAAKWLVTVDVRYDS